jgi:hypothetical protein
MKSGSEHHEIVALADNDGIARVFNVNMEQVKAAFGAVGSEALQGTGQKKIVFYVGERTIENDFTGAIGESAFKIERLAETIGTMVVSLQKEINRQEEICEAMVPLVDIIRDQAEELNTLLRALDNSIREAREGKRPKVTV